MNALAIHWLCSIRAIWNAAAAVLRHLLVLTDRLQMQRASAQLLCFLLLCDLENLKGTCNLKGTTNMLCVVCCLCRSTTSGLLLCSHRGRCTLQAAERDQGPIPAKLVILCNNFDYLVAPGSTSGPVWNTFVVTWPHAQLGMISSLAHTARPDATVSSAQKAKQVVLRTTSLTSRLQPLLRHRSRPASRQR